MIKLDLPPGESVLIRLPDGEELFVFRGAYEDTLHLRLDSPFERHIGWLWQPASYGQRAREALVIEVQRTDMLK